MFLSLAIFAFSCDSDNDNNDSNTIVAPDSYEFTRNGESSVSFSGQTTRLMQAEELYAALNSSEATETGLDLMFNGDSNGSAGFADASLNGTSKIIGSKTAASTLAGSATTKARFDDMITDFIMLVGESNEVVLINISGLLNLEELREISKSIDIKGIERLGDGVKGE